MSIPLYNVSLNHEIQHFSSFKQEIGSNQLVKKYMVVISIKAGL